MTTRPPRGGRYDRPAVIGVVAAVCIVVVLAAQAAAVEPAARPPGARAHRRRRRTAAGDGRPPTPVPTDGGWLVNVLRRRRWLRRSLSFASVAVTLVAVGMIGYPFYTNLYADRVQDRLERQFASEELRADYETCRSVGVENEACRIDDGDSLTRIRHPRHPGRRRRRRGRQLQRPAGRRRPLPEHAAAVRDRQRRHRRAPHHLRAAVPRPRPARAGRRDPPPDPDRRVHVPRHRGQRSSRPNDVGVIAGTPDNRLTLTTCHPKGSARQRLVVVAELVASPFVTA